MFEFDRLSLEDLKKSYCYLCGRPTSDTKQFRIVDSKSGAEIDVEICKDCIERSSVIRAMED